jgi:SAM-dependent methyltransferase
LTSSIEREQRFYDHRWSLDSEDLTPREAKRIQVTLDHAPLGCRRLLDLGCGDGRLSNAIRKRFECLVVGLDISTAGLTKVTGPRCCGSAARLPFPDRSFDTVLATEMIEHIPPSLYAATLREMSRVAAQFILVTVPNGENLSEVTGECGACHAHFHVWGHMRAFSPAGLSEMFPGFRLTEAVKFGELTDVYNRLLLWMRHRLAGAWYWEESAVCHACGADFPAPPRRPLLARVCDALNARFWAPFYKRPGWLLGVWQRDPVAGRTQPSRS